MTPQEIQTLIALADGIIPPENGRLGERLVERVEAGVNAKLYLDGMETARGIAKDLHGRAPWELSPPQIHDLIAALRDRMPGFFKQLRMDVSALYMGDPAVWKEIGFPGPSTASGGYPDFYLPPAGG